MKQNEDNSMQNGATFTEIEYTPIRRKSRESNGISVSSDEISVLSSLEAPAIVAVEETVVDAEELPVPMEEPPLAPVSFDEGEDCVQEASGDESAFTADETIQEEVAALHEDISLPESSTMRVVLPDEISLADVILSEEPSQTIEIDECDSTSAPSSVDSETDDGDPPFVLTPMPEPVEYERIVLPDEISLVDVLEEIRPSLNSEEENTDTTEGSEQSDIEETAVEEAIEAPCDISEIESVVSVDNADNIEETTVEISPTLPVSEGTLASETEETASLTEIPETYGSEEIPLLPEEASFADESDAEEAVVTDSEEFSENNIQTDDSAPKSVSPSDNPVKETTPEPKERPIEGRFDMIELFAFTLAFVLLLTTFFFRSSSVVGSSMEGTLHNADQLILYAFMYEPKAGDIIVFEDYSTGYREPLVKRVIATAGQRVEIYDAYNVYVDGEKLEEDYIFLDGYDSTKYPIIHTVAEGHIFVMGDHRNASADSRIFLDVSTETVLGKVLFRYYPFDTFTKFD